MKMKNQNLNQCSEEHLEFLRKRKKMIFKVRFLQISILVISLVVWEVLSRLNIIDSFIVSSPSRIMDTIISLYCAGQLWNNLMFTVLETVAGFILGTVLGMIIATLIWWSTFIFKVSEPYLVVLNALPKVALGPIIIVWMGAGMGSIILMALLVSVVISIMNILHGFENVSKEKILLMKSFGATKMQIFQKLVLPSNISTIVSTLKINVGMSLIGVITGEFLVSANGIGYLIVYGGQVFKMDLVMAGVFILAMLAWGMYACVARVEHRYSNKS